MLICYVRTTKDIKRDCERRMFRRHGPSYLFIKIPYLDLYTLLSWRLKTSHPRMKHTQPRDRSRSPNREL